MLLQIFLIIFGLSLHLAVVVAVTGGWGGDSLSEDN